MQPVNKKLCFVLMPFKDEMIEVYSDAIKPAIEQAGFVSLRVDELKGTFNINKKIIEYIFTSDAILADLTGWNPNVFYEMGVAHAIGNKTLMIIQKKDELPFDIRTYRVIQYEQTESGLERLKSQIADHLACINEWRKEPTNPVQDFKPHDAFVPKSELTAMQNQLREKDELLRHSIPRQKYDEKLKEIEALKNELRMLKGQVLETQAEHKESQKQLKLIQKSRDEALAQVEQLNRKIANLEIELTRRRESDSSKESESIKEKIVAPKLRSWPASLSFEDVSEMLKKYDFFDTLKNTKGKGFEHKFETRIINGKKVVIDYALSLMWQQDGSPDNISYDLAKEYIEELNQQGFAGFQDWRFPTLEEAMSLVEPKENKNGLYIDPIFDAEQRWIWTSDPKLGDLRASWVVHFPNGYCSSHDFKDFFYVRGVRSIESSIK